MWGVLVGALLFAFLPIYGLRVFRGAVVSVFHHGHLWRFYFKAVSRDLGVECFVISVLRPVVAIWSVSSHLFIIIQIKRKSLAPCRGVGLFLVWLYYGMWFYSRSVFVSSGTYFNISPG